MNEVQESSERVYRKTISLPPAAVDRLMRLRGLGSEGEIIRRALEFYEKTLRPTKHSSETTVVLEGGGAKSTTALGAVTLEHVPPQEKVPISRKVSLTVSSVIVPAKQVSEGLLVLSTSKMWRDISDRLQADWSFAYTLSASAWEEIIAGAFAKEGYEVILTPQSRDKGRDVIAIKRGVGCVKIIGSVKAYKPGHLVRHDDVRALLGVLSGESDASKGMVTTTSDFAPGILTDSIIKKFLPTRLELMNGIQLSVWLAKLAKSS